jgi:glycosyltransferase involved in cell wall biosynthesis
MRMQIIQEKLRVSVVIPARNEAKNLYHFLPHIPANVDEIILVDGHSTDDTIAVAQNLCPRIRVLRQVGMGKGDAMRVGFAACTQDVIVMLDSDGSADPTEISQFVTALEKGSDFAKGSRFLKGGGSHDITFLRRIGNYALCSLVNLLFRQRFSDLCYGYNAFRRDCLTRIELDCTGFEVEAQLCLRVQKAGLKIVEVASLEHQRIHGQSNLKTFKDGWRILKVIFHEWRNPPMRENANKEEQRVPAYNEAVASFPSGDNFSM